jgi:hypothetical protein
MRPVLVAALLLVSLPAAAQRVDGPVAGGAFGMSGADYFGDIHDRPPFGREARPARVRRHSVVAAAKPRRARAIGRGGPH